MPKINIEGNTPTPTGSSITEVVIEYKGQATTEVPAGELFDIYVRGIARNPGAYTWEVLVTAISSVGEIAVYDTTDAYGDPFNLPRMKIDTVASGYSRPIMPSQDITLRVKLWGNDHRGQTLPPVTEW